MAYREGNIGSHDAEFRIDFTATRRREEMGWEDRVEVSDAALIGWWGDDGDYRDRAQAVAALGLEAVREAEDIAAEAFEPHSDEISELYEARAEARAEALAGEAA